MILTDTDIQKAINNRTIEITHFDRNRLGSNSYDLTLSPHLMTYKDEILDCKRDHETIELDIPQEGFILRPGILYLGSTTERTKVGNHAPWIEGKSSIGRLGITIHITAGFGDIGFNGHWTLEITCVKPVKIYAGMPICQIAFLLPLGVCGQPYYMKDDAKYAGQLGKPVASKMYKNFSK
jgi:dCTP deaminase